MRDQSATAVTLKVPIEFKRRRGRKRVVAPNGTTWTPQPAPAIDGVLVKAIARAHRWQRMLDSGEYATLRELAKAERLDAAYVSRMLRLTLLAPALVEAILEGRHPERVTLPALIKQFDVEWAVQTSGT